MGHPGQPVSQPVVRLTAPGNVLSWLPITDPAASADNAAMLSYWGITRGPKPYYYQPAPAWSK